MLFPKKTKTIIKEVEDEIDNNCELPIKNKKEKCCSYCKDPTHSINKCEKVMIELNNITEYCSEYENQLNIPKTRKFLSSLDKKIIDRYVKKNNIRTFMSDHCYNYYDNNQNSNIELIIGYLCVLPLHPEIKNKRIITKKKSESKLKPEPNSSHFGIFVGTQGIGFNYIL